VFSTVIAFLHKIALSQHQSVSVTNTGIKRYAIGMARTANIWEQFARKLQNKDRSNDVLLRHTAQLIFSC
jgi:hypothetical protein